MFSRRNFLIRVLSLTRVDVIFDEKRFFCGVWNPETLFWPTFFSVTMCAEQILIASWQLVFPCRFPKFNHMWNNSARFEHLFAPKDPIVAQARRKNLPGGPSIVFHRYQLKGDFHLTLASAKNKIPKVRKFFCRFI